VFRQEVSIRGKVVCTLVYLILKHGTRLNPPLHAFVLATACLHQIPFFYTIQLDFIN
jgi:hypothetical protein